jgi:hypothetical protein
MVAGSGGDLWNQKAPYGIFLALSVRHFTEYLLLPDVETILAES